MANGTDNDKDQANNQNDQDQHKKVTFDDAQQERVNELIREAQGRAAKEVRAEAERAKKEAADLKVRLEALEAEKVNNKVVEPKKADDDLRAEVERIKNSYNDELGKMRKIAETKEAEAVKAAEALNSLRKQAAIQAAASKVNFVDVNVVTTLTKDSIKFDNDLGRFVVLNENGSHRMNSSFEATTLDEYYAEFAASHPYLVRGDVKSGAGSSEDANNKGSYGRGVLKVEDVFGPKSTPKIANDLIKTNPKEYQRLKAQARELGLIG